MTSHYTSIQRKGFLTIAILLVAFTSLLAQNTVGLISYDITQSFQGYTLIYPHNQPNVYLIDNCGEIAHTWTDDADFRPGNTAYLRGDGSLVKTKRRSSVAGDAIWAGGGGAFVEIYTWDNQLIWTYERNNDTTRLHHDIAPMPNGNILVLSWELKSKAEAIANGRDTALLSQEVLWPDMVLELNPDTDEVVWEWHAWDHLIQDFDSTKANYGVISEHKELIDLNYDTNDGKSDWLHANALDYNPELDQIMISVPTFSEIWVIDHSTTTAQAASHVGGRSNHGGDLLYRSGNLQAYQQGEASDQLLFYQHDAHWANEFLPGNHPFADHIVCFNNRLGNGTYSAIEIFQSTWNMYLTDYEHFNGAFPPFEFTNTVTHPDTFSFESSGLSSAQILPNGNILSCSGRQGYIIELTPDNKLVWEYIVPLRAGAAVEQGTILEINNNLTFRAFRYPFDYSAFYGRDLSSKGFLELMPNEDYCDELVSTMTPERFNFSLYPNPASNMVHLTWDSGKVINIRIYDLLGRVQLTTTGNGGMKYLDISKLDPNLYFVELEGMGGFKLMVQ